MKRSGMVMSLVDRGIAFEPAEALVCEPERAPLVGGEGCWGTPLGCPEGAGFTMGCAVEPGGAGVRPALEDILQEDEDTER